MFDQFIRLANSSQFREQLVAALDFPESEAARILEARLRTMVRVSGRNVPRSPTERGLAEGQFLAMVATMDLLHGF